MNAVLLRYNEINKHTPVQVHTLTVITANHPPT